MVLGLRAGINVIVSLEVFEFPLRIRVRIPIWIENIRMSLVLLDNSR
ncbi:MAG: hypothetical protein ACI915_003829 [Gammaproteobacteria bacterium]|jgi:hypothetical protein